MRYILSLYDSVSVFDLARLALDSIEFLLMYVSAQASFRSTTPASKCALTDSRTSSRKEVSVSAADP